MKVSKCSLAPGRGSGFVIRDLSESITFPPQPGAAPPDLLFWSELTAHALTNCL